MQNFPEILKISSIYIGAILGAGFAGGRELVTFFIRFGIHGVFASIIAGILFMLLGSAILYMAHHNKNNTYYDYLLCIFPKRIAYLFCATSEIFLLVCFIIMLSGGGALISEVVGFPSYIGSLITALISFFVLSGGVKYLGSTCSFLTPVMIIGILYVDIYSLLTSSVPTSFFEASHNNGFFFSAILYVGYNMLSCAPVLVSASSLAKNKKNALLGGIAGALVLLFVAFLTCLTLYLADSRSLLGELPLLLISEKINAFSYTIYSVVLYMAILTTAFSTGLPIAKKIESFSLSPKASALILCIVSIPLSFFKFSFLVEYCYTAFGFLGIFLICAILLKSLTSRKTEIFKENPSNHVLILKFRKK